MADNEFQRGQIVTPAPNMYVQQSEGEVTDVQPDGYVSVRFAGGKVFAFWPQELVKTGKQIDESVVPALERLDRAIEESESLSRKLHALRDGIVSLGLKDKA